MTDTTFTEKDLSFETLFKNGVCMTYNPFEPRGATHYAIELKNEYCRQNNVKHALVKSKAELSTGMLCPKFHYFSDGLLIHRFMDKEEAALQRVLKMFAIRNLPIRKIYALAQIFDYWRAENYMRNLSDRANLLYPYRNDIKIAPLPKLEEFIKDCFANGNILLSASKEENIDPNVRNCVALFADGRYYVSDQYSMIQRYNDKNIKIFRKEHKEYVFLEEVYVPREYIVALYKEAEKYEWYASVEEIEQKNRQSATEISEMNRYIENLFNGRKCLSVTNLEPSSRAHPHFTSDPDVDKYALFTDGTLVVGNSRANVKNTYWYDQMCLIYQELKFKVEFVPDYYIPAIYAALPKYQRSARDIYMEMLKEKAKKLKKELNVTHHEALDIAAKIDNWDSFQTVKIEDEAHARYLISAAKTRQEFSNGSLLREYEMFYHSKK